MTKLSDHTWIEDGYIVTTSNEVAAAWGFQKEWADPRFTYNGGWSPVEPNIDFGGPYRLSLTAAKSVYQYVEGEPWCDVATYDIHDGEDDNVPPDRVLHLRAVIPCGGSAESLRALAEALR